MIQSTIDCDFMHRIQKRFEVQIEGENGKVLIMKKPSFEIPVYNARSFTWTPGANGLAEITDFAGRETWKRIWDDACDVGFWVENPETKTRVLFVFVKECKGEGDELIGWSFHSTGHPNLIKIVIFND